jgi:ERCC4-type nuclease
MIIKIDTREQDLLVKCQYIVDSNPKFKYITLISTTLPLGDIIINDGTNDSVIIERKSLSDLAASIKDGRYDEQSYRLNGLNHHNHNIVYLIEGDLNSFNSSKVRIDKLTLYSAMFSINYFKGFSLMRSMNLEETALIVCNMVHKLVSGLKNGKQGFYSNIETSDENVLKETVTEKDYCSVIKKVKKDNITTENIGEIMLCQIPGVSSTSALAILSKFKTLPNLIKNIQEDELCLNDVCTTDANGKTRKISKTTILTIVNFLKI